MSLATVTSHLPEWGSATVLTAVLLSLVAVLYLRAWRVVSRTMPGQVPAWRFGAFLAGLATTGVSWSSQLTALTHVFLIAHMAQHLLSMLFAPPLLLLGSPVLVFAGGRMGEPREPRGRFQFLLHGWGHWLTHPVTAGCITVATTIGWHIPGVFSMAMSSAGWCALENATFWATGMLFWWPVILPWPSRRQWPRWTIPLYLLGSDLPISILSAYLAFCGHAVYPMYRLAPRVTGISALNDQVAAAMLMWVVMLVVFLGVAVAVVVDWLEPLGGLTDLNR